MDMKKLMFYLFALVLCGCGGNAELKRVATGEPILPIREAGDTTEVYLTDYLPSVDLSKVGKVSVTDGYDNLIVTDSVVTLYGSAAQVGALSVGKRSSKVDIPILPKLPTVQGLTTQGVQDGRIVLAADKAFHPLRFQLFVQNRLLPEEALVDNQDGTYGVELNKLPKLKGRSYLRVYACNGKALLNDLLIPLNDGAPVLNAS